MTRLKFFGVVPVALALAGVGCSTPPAQSAATVTTDGTAGGSALEEDQASVELKAHHRHHHGGFAGFVLASAETIGVTPEQKAGIEKLKADFRAKVDPVRVANGAVMAVLADGVAAGSLDQAKLDAALAGVGAAAANVHGATADLLNQLHTLLRPEQRASLVDKIDAHWTIWKETNAGDQAADNQKPDGHINHLAKEIGLSPDQVAKTQAALAALSPAARGPFDPAAGEAHLKAFSAAFLADPFDAKTLTTADAANKGVTGWGAARMVKFYQALTPVLTADQRAKVSATLREHANEP
jgi:Spy/CpxP family protein refolding chaperone